MRAAFATNRLEKGNPMLAYQFEAIIENGTIRVPDEYLSLVSPKVKVLLLPDSTRTVDKARFFPDLKLHTQGIGFDREDANGR
ncbi:MAG: hypothetical protein LBU43_08315 [Candidatus Accumulibacter sp.]|jgi:hypothetical protein|nr:hypothetical protein [Accumulibacter sp.]